MIPAHDITFRAKGTDGRGGVYAYFGEAIVSLDSWVESTYGVAGLEMAWGPAPKGQVLSLATALLLCCDVPERQLALLAPMFAGTVLKNAPDEWEMTALQILGFCAALPLYVKLNEWSQGRERWQNPSRN